MPHIHTASLNHNHRLKTQVISYHHTKLALLKDKARNLKLFFLKTNSEMPYYLQAVTGELKTRAPTQAARKEAEERARMNSEEDQAKIQGIMTLAGGLQNSPQRHGRAAGTPASAVGSGVMTPAQNAAQAASSQQSQAHNQVAAHSYNPATSSGYPPSTLPQSRPSVMSAAQQSPHQAARPQSQMSMSPQTPRSQHQQLPQQHHSAMHSPAHAQAAAAQSRSHTTTPVGQLHHSPPPHHTPTPQPATQHHSQPHYPAAPHTQLTFPSSPPTNATPIMHTHGQVPVPAKQKQMDHHMHDNAAEAALLQGLQAAVAESL
ncbi:hypothetical protein IL306_004477 [Fusarium sp. DS 682]|nr:hypothetical protein IL306_004477 [Fusarium sp. DS 682]